MVVRPKLMVGAGIAVAGLGLIGAGAGATFTTQVSAETSISSGGLGLSLNGETGSDFRLGFDGKNLGSHFKPIITDLSLTNTGTLDMASNFVDVTVTGCNGGDGADLAKALHVTLTDTTHKDVVYEGALCSLVRAVDGHKVVGQNLSRQDVAGYDASGKIPGFLSPAAHEGVGGQLPRALEVGQTILYRMVIEPSDVDGLPADAQFEKTTVKLVFSGFDY